MSTAEPVSVKQRAIAKLRLWFFRDISSEQRRSLFSIFGMPVNEVKKHGDEAHCLQHILAALSHVQAPATSYIPEHWRTRAEGTVEQAKSLNTVEREEAYKKAVMLLRILLVSSPAPQVDEAMVERALDAYYPTLWPDGLNEKDAADFRVTMRKALEAALETKP